MLMAIFPVEPGLAGIIEAEDDGSGEPASVAQWAEEQCAPTGAVCRRGGVQSRVGR